MKGHIRADTHRHSINAAKEAVVMRFVRDYHQVAKQIAKRQWRLLFETGATNKRKNDDKDLNPLIGAAPVQMARFQVAEQIDGWWANRANEFRAARYRMCTHNLL